MLTLFYNIAQIVTVNTNGINLKRGNSSSELSPLYNHSIVVENGIIKDIVPIQSAEKNSFDAKIDLGDNVVLPGLIECHTHTAFAGSRSGEFRKKLQKISYEDIDKGGGGINTTVKAVRNTSSYDLLKIIKPRIDYFISQGITTLEIKSGYGLNFPDEIKLLQVINKLNEIYPIDILPTFLGAHTFPPEYKNDNRTYIDIITQQLLPYISENKLAVFCDAFCEKTAFDTEQVNQIFTAAKNLGFKIKLHSDQFNSMGGLDIALKYNAISVDHLEVINQKDILKLSNSETVAVILPGVSFFLNYNYAPARKLIDNNALVALSTDFNPGSSHIANLNLIMSIAALKMDMTIEEIISGVTINAAKALDLNYDRGSIEINKKADLSVFKAQEYPDIIYNVGKNLNIMTIKNGKVIYSSQL